MGRPRKKPHTPEPDLPNTTLARERVIYEAVKGKREASHTHRRIDLAERMYRRGQLSTRQYRAAELIALAYERRHRKGEAPEKVDDSRDPTFAVVALMDRILREVDPLTWVTPSWRPIVEHVCHHNLSFREWSQKTSQREAAARNFRQALDQVAYQMGFV